MKAIKRTLCAVSGILLLVVLLFYALPLKPDPDQNYSLQIGANRKLFLMSRGLDRWVLLAHESGTAPFPTSPLVGQTSSRDVRIWGMSYSTVQWPGRELSALQFSMLYLVVGLAITPSVCIGLPWVARLRRRGGV